MRARVTLRAARCAIALALALSAQEALSKPTAPTADPPTAKGGARESPHPERECAEVRARAAAGALTSAEIDEAFERGKNAYLYGAYSLTVACLEPLITPDLLISNPEELALGYEYLALAHFYLERLPQAEGLFKSLIFFRPSYELDPVRVPPDAVTFYARLRDALAGELKERQVALDEQRAREAEALRSQMSREVIIEQRVNSRFVALLPFGIGQFQNQDPVAGYTFMISEGLLAAASAALFWSIESMRLPNGRFARQDLSAARDLQTAQVLTGGGALGLMVGGVIHALIFYEPMRPTRRFERPLSAPPPPSLAAPPAPLPPPPPSDPKPDPSLDAEGFE